MFVPMAIFWSSLFLVFWAYVGYLLTLKIISLLYSKKVNRRLFSPEVSLIITAFNEEKRIAKKIENSLSLDYPRNKMEIIVVSDGSTDGTEDIVNSYEDRGIKLLALDRRNGKHYSQGRGIEFAKNDIIILSDATTFLKNDAVEKIVRNFADPEIGCVSGRDEIQSEDSGDYGEGAYVKYEMKLRFLESEFNSLVGVSGCFFAVRKHLCENWIDNMSSDFYLPIITYMRGYRTILEREAVGYYEVLDDPRDEFTRKVRTVVHGLEVLSRFIEIINPFRYGIFSIQILSHKLLRWLVPLFLFFIFWTNIFLAGLNTFYASALLLQILFYALAFFAFIYKDLQNKPVFRFPLFFVMVNYSIAVAWYNFIIGEKFVLWEPTKR